MNAVFGRLQNETLELRDGLNIIEAPNESGKSTWCAFLAAMLYGVNSRERDRVGFIADKNRYAPWSGAPMSGRLDCVADGREITITRATRRATAPMGDFQAVYAGTGDAVAELTGQTCGETLLGVGREVYERSALIRQAGLAITQDAGLERRIAALITSGEEDVSYMEASEALKKQLNRRRHHKTGQLPALESRLEELRQQQSELTGLARQHAAALAQTQVLEQQIHALEDELASHDRWEAAAASLACAQTREASLRADAVAEALRKKLAQAPPNETIGRLRGAIVNLETVRRSVEKARAERDEALKAVLRAEAAVNESAFAGQTAEEARKSPDTLPHRPRALWPVTALLGAIAGGVLGYFAGAGIPLIVWIAGGGLFSLAAGLGLDAARRGNWRKAVSDRLGKYHVASREELTALADAYSELLRKRDAAQETANAKSATADALYASLSSNEQGILLEVRRFAPSAFDIASADALLRQCAADRRELSEAESAARESRLRLELQQQALLPDSCEDAPSTPPLRSRESVEAQLSEAQQALAVARSAADRLSGQLHAQGDPVVLASESDLLAEQIAAAEQEYDALLLAMETLDTANTALQNRFSPALGRRAAEIFSQLTQQRYQGVVLDRSFHLSAEPMGDPTYRDASLLSAGAADQLYLAVRLAICELVLPAEQAAPIVLDDALTNFDDERCALALRWLKEEAKSRQILLFTCHTREAEFFAGDCEVFVQRLTESVDKV